MMEECWLRMISDRAISQLTFFINFFTCQIGKSIFSAARKKFFGKLFWPAKN